MNSPKTDLVQLKQNIVKRISLGLNLLALYPPDHPEVKAGITMISSSFAPYFQVEEEFLLGVSLKGWVVENVDLTKENIQFGASARELHRRGISAIAFYKGLNEEVLLIFFQLATLPLEQIEANKGLINMAARIPLTYINLFALDYSQFLKNSTLFQNNFFNNKENRDEILCSWDSGKIIESFSSENLALVINQIYKNGDDKNLDNIIVFLEELGARCLQKQSRQNVEPENFFRMLSQLNPNVIRKVVQSFKSQGETREILPTGDIIYDPFRNRLLDLFNSFSSSLESNLDPKETSARTLALQKIFQMEKQESSSEPYKTFISNTVQKTSELLSHANLSKEKQKIFLDEISTANIKKTAVNVVLDLLEAETDPNEYYKLISLLPHYFDYWLKVANFQVIFEIFYFLDRHISIKENEMIRGHAQSMLAQFFTSSTIFELIQSWIYSGETDENYREKLLLRLDRSTVITQLRLILFSSDDENIKNKISTLLSKLMSSNISLLEDDIKSSDENTIKEAIRVLRNIPTERTAEILGHLLKYPQVIVNSFAYEALLEHGTQKSVEILISLLPSVSKDEFPKVARSIAFYGKTKTLEKLRPFLAAQDILERRYKRKMVIIASFGECKNNEAVLLLSSIFNHSPFLRKSKNNSFRAAILNSLAKIGSRDALTAIAILRNSGDTIIQITGETLLQTTKNL